MKKASEEAILRDKLMGIYIIPGGAT